MTAMTSFHTASRVPTPTAAYMPSCGTFPACRRAAVKESSMIGNILVDVKKVGRDPNDHGYARHNGKPVVSVWGLGFGRAYEGQESL